MRLSGFLVMGKRISISEDFKLRDKVLIHGSNSNGTLVDVVEVKAISQAGSSVMTMMCLLGSPDKILSKMLANRLIKGLEVLSRSSLLLLLFV